MSDEATLCIEERANEIHIGWFFAEEGEFGLMLGEEWRTGAPRPKDPDKAETWDAEHAVVDFAGNPRPSEAFTFASMTTAKKALRLAKAAIKAGREGRPLEEWEQKALAAGWTPPKKKGK